ncbi:MAG: ATP-binding cassette subfamily C protein [Arenicella sp.]|jgi:ATP-binding cassette subfamily C protein
MGIKSLFALKPLIIKCVEFAPYKVLTTLLLMLLRSLSSGIGILLIVPLMTVVGVDLGGAASGYGVSNSISNIVVALGIPLELVSILTLYLILIIFMASVNFLSTVVSASLSQSFTVYLRTELARALFYTQWHYLNRSHMSDFMRLLTRQVQSASSSLQSLLALVSSLILVAVYLCFSFFLSPKLTLVALVCGLFLIFLLWPVNKRIHASGGVGLRASREMYRAIFENVASLKIIKSFAAEERYLQQMHSSNQELELQHLRITKINALTSFVNMVGAAVIFTILFYSAIQWLHLAIANLLAILFIFSRLMPQISLIQSTVQRLIHQAPSYQDLVDQSAELGRWAEPQYDDAIAPRLTNRIVLKDVCYQHLESAKPVLEKVNATIERNQTIAVVGPSGAGKSTLADLICGLIEPVSGQVLVDDQVIDHSNRVAWRQNVAYVTQDVFLFHASIRENLIWVCDQSEFESDALLEQELWRVLELAAASEFVKMLPQGLDALIGDRGVKLSGGERQRIALARALLAKPDVLILDEATSALDNQNELKIKNALVELDGELTIIIIAHNEITIEHVTQRIVLGRTN